MVYERVSDDYFVYLRGPKEFFKVQGQPVTIGGVEADLFVYDLSQIAEYGFAVTEAISGERAGVYSTDTPEEALLETERCFAAYLSKRSLQERIDAAVEKHGASPRYRIVQ